MYKIIHEGEVIDLVRTLKEAKEYGYEYIELTEEEEIMQEKEKHESEAYDSWADRIICSKDFLDCKDRDEDGYCRLKDKACWHINPCPKNLKRR